MKTIILLAMIITLSTSMFSQTYTMPHENDPHEGTWLQWPHQYEYGVAYRNSLDATWVAMTQALVANEKVHIIAYNSTEQTRIANKLTTAGVSLTNVTFLIAQTNDVWVRDNGPIFVRDASGNLKIEDWGFNGWGTKYGYTKCNPIPTTISTSISVPVINLNSVMVNEGGAVELDGNGVLMACKSSIISQAPANSIRNLGMTQAQAETHFTQYLGVSKFIWLDGKVGDAADVTDFHIDGFAKFVDDSILVTMNNADLTYWGATATDIATLYNASNINNKTYTKVYLPLTQNNVVTTSGTNLGYKGSYANYYVANGVILVPNYNDPNDAIANGIIQLLYAGRTAIGIDVRNLYENGGMVHCVTQQQPVTTIATGLNQIENNTRNDVKLEQNFPNPFIEITSFNLTLSKETDCKMEIYNSLGQFVKIVLDEKLAIGKHVICLDAKNFINGIYTCVLITDSNNELHKKIIVSK